MGKKITIALAAAVLIGGGVAFFLVRRPSGLFETRDSPPPGDPPPAGTVPAAGTAREVAGRARSATPSGGETSSESPGAAETGSGSRRLADILARRRVPAGGPGAGSPAPGAVDAAPGEAGADGEAGPRQGTAPLEGPELTAAIEKALEDEDLARLQGLLISELTLKGTRLSAEDLPLLVDALLDVEDYGLQKLIMTHLERMEAPPEELVRGYLDYLDGEGRRPLAEDVFTQLVKVGGDESVLGLGDFVRQSDSETLRRQAAQALGELGDRRGVAPVEDALSRVEDPRLARDYLQALARLGGPEGIGALVEYAATAGNESALGVLREVRDPAAGPILADALDDRVSEPFQREALRKLGELRDPRTLPEMDRFLKRARGRLLTDTILALGRFRDAGAARVLEEFAARQLDPAIARLAQKSAERIHRMLENPPRSPPASPPRREPSRTDRERRARG